MEDIVDINMGQIIFQKFITRKDIQAHPDWLYIFGDNDQRIGKGGQAKEIRGEPNSIGIRVKKAPKTGKNVYYNDIEILDNILKITKDFKVVINHLINDGIVVIPKDGIGTGLAKLKDNAPKTLAFINMIIKELVEKYGEIK